jgi:hypothetical protein
MEYTQDVMMKLEGSAQRPTEPSLFPRNNTHHADNLNITTGKYITLSPRSLEPLNMACCFECKNQFREPLTAINRLKMNRLERVRCTPEAEAGSGAPIIILSTQHTTGPLLYPLFTVSFNIIIFYIEKYIL